MNLNYKIKFAALKKQIFIIFNKVRILKYKFISDHATREKYIINQPLLLLGNGEIKIDSEVIFGEYYSPFFFSGYSYIEARCTESKIVIGQGTKINNNFICISHLSHIKIGQNCLIGFNVEITDSDFHGINGKMVKSEPVEIGNNVFIGSNVKILKGVKVGDGAVVGNSSLVTKDIPAGKIYCGNPAKEINKNSFA